MLCSLIFSGMATAVPNHFILESASAGHSQITWIDISSQFSPHLGQYEELALPILYWKPLRSQWPVISSTAFLSCHLLRESSSLPHRSPVSPHRSLDLLQPSVASYSASHRLLMWTAILFRPSCAGMLACCLMGPYVRLPCLARVSGLSLPKSGFGSVVECSTWDSRVVGSNPPFIWPKFFSQFLSTMKSSGNENF